MEALADRIDDELVVAEQLLGLVGVGVRPRRVRGSSLVEKIRLGGEEVELTIDELAEAPAPEDHTSSRYRSR